MQVQSTKRCRTCGIEKPLSEYHRWKYGKDGLKPVCKPCYCAEVRAHTAEHRSDIAERRRAKYHANPEKYLAQQRAARERDSEKLRQRKREEHLRHAEYYRQKSLRWYRANREYAIRRGLQRQRDNPHLANDRNQRRRARVKGAPVVEKIDRAAIIARDNGICQICGLPVAPEDLHLDHIIPLFQGGTHTADNLRVTHRWCNLSRKRTSPE